MGGKGRKRREKNYRVAHGGHTRLPPPPDPSQVDALPSKLRKIMSFASRDVSAKVDQEKRKRGDGDDHKKGSVMNVVNEEAKRDDSESEIAHGNETNEKRKKKRKRKQVSDLRFETAEIGSASKKKERKKK